MAEPDLHAIDLVTVAMDFDTGVRPDDAIADLIEFGALQAPSRSAPEQRAVCG